MKTFFDMIPWGLESASRVWYLAGCQTLRKNMEGVSDPEEKNVARAYRGCRRGDRLWWISLESVSTQRGQIRHSFTTRLPICV